ncbi:Uu.00g074490.m01.CDS01 [Anthostomella pinea]|uniref:Uu.00g074490.m01.CDS01 n=1 Tax=Anthostomella pinea TaxID=933095 RepID=A0AAI8YNX8_9PEZI|nr:Uu.00g074490.m01.CDS01 [Anthostomella pinea]
MAKLLAQTRMKWFPIDLPAADSFKDQAIVITGGTGGLGLAAAVHFVNLGATEVIITSRNASRGKSALATIERETNGRSKGVVRTLDLDMNRNASIVAFADEVKKLRAGRGGIDFVLLNAGLIGVEFTPADEGWEQNLQVNTLGTALLALLLLPWMKAERANRASPAHMAAIGSGQHLDPDIQTWAAWSAEGVLAHYNKPANWPGAQVMYATTKLLLQSAFNELAELAVGEDGRPEVILNTVCPGIVKTDLSRGYKKASYAFVVLAGVFTGLFGKSPENGARAIVHTALTKEGEHGKFIRFYGSETEYRERADAVIYGQAGKRMQAQVWAEMTGELAAKVPEVRNVLGPLR